MPVDDGSSAQTFGDTAGEGQEKPKKKRSLDVVDEDEDDGGEADDEDEDGGLAHLDKRQRRPNLLDPPPDLPSYGGDKTLGTLPPGLDDIVKSGARDLFEEVQGILTDPTWAEWMKQKGLTGASSYYQRASKYKLPAPVAKATPRKLVKGKKKKIAQTGAVEVSSEYSKDMSFAGNVRQKGQWLDEGVMSGPVPKDASYDLVLLNEMSQAMINAVKKTVEIEAMVLDDRMFVSANEQATVVELCGQSLDELLTKTNSKFGDWEKAKAKEIAKLRESLTKGTGDTDRLVMMTVGSSMYPEQEKAIEAELAVLRQTALKVVDGGSAASAGGLITRANLKNHIIAVHGTEISSGPTSHAEQNLILALTKSSYAGSAVSVGGGKRPCTICFLSLSLVKKYRYPQLRFNAHPGGLWDGTTKAGLADIATALNLDIKELRADAKEFLGDVTQYVTSRDLTAPESTLIADLPGSVHVDKELSRQPTLHIPRTERGFSLEEQALYAPLPGDDMDSESSISSDEDSPEMNPKPGKRGIKDVETPPSTWVDPGPDMDMDTDTEEV
jgi:hypothetical protein